jgi:hypothetical protein
MATYQLLSGETIEYEIKDPLVRDYLGQIQSAANDPQVSMNEMIALVYNVANPVLDKNLVPGRAMVTPEIFANPVYRVMADLVWQKQFQQPGFDIEKANAQFTLTVPQAAKRLGITPASVRAAITAKKISAILRNGQWWIHPNSIASYKVSNRGRHGNQRSKRKAKKPSKSSK